MAPSFDALRVRLIQVRIKPDILREEHASFVERAGLNTHQIIQTNAIRDVLSGHLLDDVDAVFIGGAGAYSVTHTYPWTADLIHLIEVMYDRKLPLFGSCWGHQFIARALGGKVINDPDRAEMGCHSVSLTSKGKNDPLFAPFPTTFKANMGHQDRVSILPAGAVELAYNATAPYQAYRIVDRPIYGTQFHSELNAESERKRLYAYRDHYPAMQNDTLFQATLDTLAETTEVDGLLEHFLRHYAVK